MNPQDQQQNQAQNQPAPPSAAAQSMPGGQPDPAAQAQNLPPAQGAPDQARATGGAAPNPNNPMDAPKPPQKQKDQTGVTTTKVTTENPNSTQNTLLVKEVRDGMAIMGDGSLRAAVACRSINFDLMSSGEREGVEYSYQNFLNSLYFTAQILIRSQRVDIRPYLERLARMRRDQDNMLLGMLTDDYINFVDQVSEETNIMDKQFFIIMPFYPGGDPSSSVNSSKNLFTGLFAGSQQSVVHINKQTYQKAKDELQNRVSTVVNGLMQLGVQATRLNTKQFRELLYNLYNPDTAVRQPLGNFDPRPAVAVRKGQGEAPNPNLNRDI